MNVETRIRTHLTALDTLTEKAKLDAKENFYAHLFRKDGSVDPKKYAEFFTVVEAELDGKKVVVYKGLIETATLAIDRNKKLFAEALRLGESFADDTIKAAGEKEE